MWLGRNLKQFVTKKLKNIFENSTEMLMTIEFWPTKRIFLKALNDTSFFLKSFNSSKNPTISTLRWSIFSSSNTGHHPQLKIVQSLESSLLKHFASC